MIVPDILANAGGVIASHAEWSQSLQGATWSADRVKRYVTGRLEAAFADVWARAQERQITLRRAAYQLGVDRTAEAVRLRGLQG